MSTVIIAWAVWPLILVLIWGLRASRREQKRLIEQIKRDQALIERINRIGGGR